MPTAVQAQRSRVFPARAKNCSGIKPTSTKHKNRYKWDTRPTTTEVRLAQEDLWILEQLCKIITNVNGQTPPYLRPIKVVRKIALEGYALDSPYPLGMNSNRILRLDAPARRPLLQPKEAKAGQAKKRRPKGLRPKELPRWVLRRPV